MTEKITTRCACLLAVLLAALAPLRSGAAASDPFSVSASFTGEGTSWVAAVTFAVPQRHHIYADSVSVEEVGGLSLEPMRLSQPVPIHDVFSDSDREAYTSDFALVYRVNGAGPTGITLRVQYQGCDDAVCFFPQSRLFPLAPGSAPPLSVPHGALAASLPPADWAAFGAAWSVRASASGYQAVPEFVAFLDAALGRPPVGEGKRGVWARVGSAITLFGTNPVEFISRFGVVWTLALIMIGGLLLNLTPCVLPMIPVNLAILGAGAHGRSRVSGFCLGAAYGAGIAAVYGALGIGVVLTGAAFGAVNALPWFNAAVAVVFVALGLAMFDVIQIDLTRFQTGGGSARAGSYAAALGAGGLAALLAGACVAPVVIAVLVLSGSLYADGVSLGLILPFILGIGMALPWPFAGAGLSFLPKPGVWMTRVKYGFGVFIMILAFYYASAAFRGWRGTPAAADEANVIHVAADQGASAWAEVFEQARASGKPVFVDFWATWCKNCKAMDASTFRDAAVRARLEAFVRVKCQVERPDDPVARITREHFRVKGLPTYVVLEPNVAGKSP